jgi:alpha-L-arabinofuranosidase
LIDAMNSAVSAAVTMDRTLRKRSSQPDRKVWPRGPHGLLKEVEMGLFTRGPEAAAVDAVATYDAKRNSTTFFLVNRSVGAVEEVEMVIAGDFAPVGVVETTPSDADVYAKNTLDDPERVSLHSNESVTTQAGTIRIQLPPVSWTVVEVAHEER